MREVPLGRSSLVALVDDDDFDLVTRFCWCIKKRRDGTPSYARAWVPGQGRRVYLHSLITGWKFVDHINGNGLDNRRENLRQATSSQNQQNTRKRKGSSSQFKGVYWVPGRCKWQAQIYAEGNRKIFLGQYANERDAALAYNVAAQGLFGEFAKLNLVNPDPGL